MKFVPPKIVIWLAAGILLAVLFWVAAVLFGGAAQQEFAPRDVTNLPFSVERAGSVEVRAKPDGCMVTISSLDNSFLKEGVAPIKEIVPVGNYSVFVYKDGYSTHQEDFQIIEGEKYLIESSLDYRGDFEYDGSD